MDLSVPSFDVSGLCFAVTGASKGLGLEVVRQLVARGSCFVLAIGGRSPSPYSEDEDKIKYVNSDLSSAQGIEAACEMLKSTFSATRKLDGFVSVAGVAFPRANMAETTPELWSRMMTVNCTAPVFLMRAAAEIMKAQQSRGSLVNVTSVAGYGGAPMIFAYSASKAALNCATKCAAVELQPSRIRCNAIAMGHTLTDNENSAQSEFDQEWLEKADRQHPMGRILRPVDLAATIGHLLSPAASMITGTIIDVCPEFVNGALPMGNRTV